MANYSVTTYGEEHITTPEWQPAGMYDIMFQI